MSSGPNASGRGRRMIRTSSRSVRSGMSYHLAELNRVLPTIRRAVDGLDAMTPSETFDRAADQMWRGVLIAREIASSATRTGCSEHPDGPEDPEPPEGWTRCLICNIRRKRGTQNHQNLTDDQARRRAPEKRDLVELVPVDVHQGLNELRNAMMDIDDRAFNLHLESPGYERDALADAMLKGFTLLRELARPVSLTGCARHPDGAVDPAPPPAGESAYIAILNGGAERADIPPELPKWPGSCLRQILKPHIRRDVIDSLLSPRDNHDRSQAGNISRPSTGAQTKH